MAIDERSIKPSFSAAESEELARMDYFRSRLSELLARGTLAESSPGSALADDHQRREAIERRGRFRAAIARARDLRTGQTAEALEWAEAALRIDDSAWDTWELAIDLYGAREAEELAIALCSEAAKRFPQAARKREQWLVQSAQRQEARRSAAEKLQRDREFSELFASAREAAARGRDPEALVLCERALAVRPGNVDVLLIAAFVHQRLDQLDEAIGIYEGLTASPRASAVWRQCLADLKARRQAERLAGQALKEPKPSLPASIDPNNMKTFLPPRFSWAAFVGELMREHWQKLVLCLAVLLFASLVGIFLGIGLRLQTFLWLGLTTFALDIGYEMVRLSVDHAVVKWAIMLALGIGLVMFVAVNEKKRIVGTMLDYYEKARLWD